MQQDAGRAGRHATAIAQIIICCVGRWGSWSLVSHSNTLHVDTTFSDSDGKEAAGVMKYV